MAARPGGRRLPLVGRSAELSELLALCAAGGAVLVAGPAGVGKSRLLDELAGRVATTGVVVLRGSAVVGGGPYRPLAEALLRAAPPALAEQERLAPFRAVLARLLPAWPAAPAVREYVVDPVVVLGEAVLELLRVIAAGGRCLLLLDDLHWADAETLRLLEYLAPVLGGEPVVLVGAARDDESSPVRGLRRRVPVLHLRKLPPEDLAALARHCADAPLSDEVGRFLTAAADGLPLLVEELFAGLVEEGLLRRDALGWHTAGPLSLRVPEAFGEVVRQRLERLPDGVRHLVRTAALLGGEPDWRLLATATSTDPGVVADALPAAVDAGLFVDDGTLRWRHALTREAVLDALSPPERAHRCRTAADALVAAGRVAGDRLALVAGLWARGGAPDRAAELLLRLGRAQIAAGALAAAVDTLTEASALAEGLETPTGERTAAAPAGETSLTAGPDSERPDARPARETGRPVGPGRAACERPGAAPAGETSRPARPDSERPDARPARETGRPVGPSGAASEQLEAPAARAGRPDALAVLADEVAAERVRALALGGRVDEALAVGERAAARGSRAVVVQLARACVIAERWGPARGWLDRAERPTSDGEGLPDPAVLALAAHVALAEGDRDQAVRLAGAAVAEGTRAHHVETVCEALEITGRAQRRADPPASRAAFARGERLAAAHGLVPWRLRALAELGGLDLLEGGDTGRLVAARRLAEECGMLGLAVGLDLQIAVDTFGGEGPVSALGPARRCVERSTRLRLSGPATHAGIFVARGLFWAGEVQASYALFDELARTAPDPPYVGSSRAAIGGFAAWLAHDPRGAVDGLGACVAELRESAVTNPAPVWGQWALLATVVDPDDPRPLAELRNADVLVQASNRAAVHYAEAVLARRDGRTDVAADLIARGDAALGRHVHSRLLLRCLMLGAADAPEPLLREVIAHGEPRGEVQLTRWCRERLRRAGRPVPRPNRDAVAVPEWLRAHGVTGRELEVLRLVARGWSNADVAAHLHLSVRTVETHVSNLLAKTGATDRSGLSAHLDP